MTQQEQKQTIAQDPVAATAPQELTDRELDEISGGIIIVGGKLASPSLALRSFSFSFG